MSINLLSEKKCQVCEGGIPALTLQEISDYLAKLSHWVLSSNQQEISRRFEFKGFQKAVMFANAVAWLVAQEGHHPEIKFGVGFCEVMFTTHAINGLTDNDFICAAKVDKLFG
jgi:4a-hydroxytetrahydrobiopterin dehydratase